MTFPIISNITFFYSLGQAIPNYSQLNQYRNKLGQVDSALCECGEWKPQNTFSWSAIFMKS